MSYTYHTDDLVLELPAELRDRTIHVIEWDVEGAKVALTIQRETASEDKTLSDQVAIALTEYRRNLAAFKLETDDTIEAAGVEVRRVRFRWKHEAAALHHHQAFFAAGGRFFVLTATGPVAVAKRIDETLESALENLRLREG